MPMFHPPSKGRDGDGQVLDLETAVKDGILGGGDGVFCDGGGAEKLDLKTMIEALDSIEIPSVFICPISLDPMQDPVTLCTGQTYERSNILKWFSLGRYSCPTTMQELWDDSLTPNTTLHRLILTWFSQKYSANKKRCEDVQGRASDLLESLRKVKGQDRVLALKELRRLVAGHCSVEKSVVDNGGIGLISSLLGPFTSYAVGSEAIGILVNLTLDSESRANLMRPAKVSLMVDMLNEGCIETKVNCTKLIELLIEESDSWPANVWSLSLLVGLLRLVKDKRHPNGVLAGLRLIKTMVRSHEPVGNSIVNIGAVPQIVELLPRLNINSNMNSECLECALSVLESISTTPEGTLALKNCPDTIPNVVKLLMRVSESCTRLALLILWEVCKIAPEQCALVAVEAGLAAKLLLVIQSGCDPELKQRSADLLKLCSLNYNTAIFISKCKLTRTMQ